MKRKTMQTKADTRYERCSCVGGKAFLNRHSRHVIASETKQSCTVFGPNLLLRASRIALLLLMAMAIVLCATGLVSAQLADSPWPMRGHDARHTGQSPYKGPKFANLKWRFDAGWDVSSSPAIGSDGTVYVGSSTYLYAINPDGSLRWKFKTGSYVYSSPAIGSDGTVYVGSMDDNLYALNPDGSLKWQFETKGNVSSSPALGSDGTVYVGSYDNNLYAVNPDGSLKWKFLTGSYVYSSSPAIGQDGTVYVGSSTYLYAINHDGSLKWKFPTGSYVSSSPAIGLDGTVYVGSDDTYLYAVNRNGDLKWKFKTGDKVYSSPAIGSDGTVYVGSRDSSIYSFERGTSSEPLVANIAPVLSQSSVIPETGTRATKFIFRIIYTDEDNDKPTSVTIQIDGSMPKPMMPADVEDIDHTDGRAYQYVMQLGAGQHQYSFAASDGNLEATGDIGSHVGPIVSNAPPPAEEGMISIWPQDALEGMGSGLPIENAMPVLITGDGFGPKTKVTTDNPSIVIGPIVTDATGTQLATTFAIQPIPELTAGESLPVTVTVTSEAASNTTIFTIRGLDELIITSDTFTIGGGHNIFSKLAIDKGATLRGIGGEPLELTVLGNVLIDGTIDIAGHLSSGGPWKCALGRHECPPKFF